VLGAAGALAVAPWVSGCSRADANTLRFWAMGREGEVAHELLDGFRAEHPGVTLHIEQLPWSAAHEKLLTAVAGDATPDVAQMGNTWLPEMVALKALEPLQPYLDATPVPAGSSAPPAPANASTAGDYFQGIWRTNYVDGQLVGLPWYVDTRLLYYRRDLLERVGIRRPPASWDDWLAAMHALHQGPVGTPQLFPVDEFEPLLALGLQTGGELLRDDATRGNFEGADFRQALGFYQRVFASGYAPAANTNQLGNVWQDFGRGQFAFYVSGPWNLGEFRRRLPASEQGIWDTTPLPGPGGPGASIAGGASLVIFKRSRVKPLAWSLIDYLGRPAVQLRFYELTGNLPPRRSPWSSAPLAGDEKARAFLDQLERVRPAPAVPEWERIAKEMQLTAARLVHRPAGLSAPPPIDPRRTDQELAALDARVDDILAKRRWMLAQRREARAAGDMGRPA